MGRRGAFLRDGGRGNGADHGLQESGGRRKRRGWSALRYISICDGEGCWAVPPAAPIPLSSPRARI